MIKKYFCVKPIGYEDCKDMILNKHYLQRMPNVKYAFGLFDLINNKKIGVLTIGKPASHSLCVGICGKEFSDKVYELNRLIVNDNLPHNALSYFVSKSLKLLKKEDIILVSYADSGMGHHGYIYQATNFIYTGKTEDRTDKYTPEGKHSRHYDSKDNHLRKYRTSKYRYVYFIGKNSNLYKQNLKYKIQEYPKGDNKYYTLGTKIINKITGEIFYE